MSKAGPWPTRTCADLDFCVCRQEQPARLGSVAVLSCKNSWLQLSYYTVGNPLCLPPTEGKSRRRNSSCF